MKEWAWVDRGGEGFGEDVDERIRLLFFAVNQRGKGKKERRKVRL